MALGTGSARLPQLLPKAHVEGQAAPGSWLGHCWGAAFRTAAAGFSRRLCPHREAVSLRGRAELVCSGRCLSFKCRVGCASCSTRGPLALRRGTEDVPLAVISSPAQKGPHATLRDIPVFLESAEHSWPGQDASLVEEGDASPRMALKVNYCPGSGGTWLGMQSTV